MSETGSRVRRVSQMAVVMVATAAAGLAGMVFRPIETTVLLVVAGVVFAVVAARSARGGGRRAGVAGVALGCLAVLGFYWTSALVNLEPDHVQDGSSSAVNSASHIRW